MELLATKVVINDDEFQLYGARHEELRKPMLFEQIAYDSGFASVLAKNNNGQMVGHNVPEFD